MYVCMYVCMYIRLYICFNYELEKLFSLVSLNSLYPRYSHKNVPLFNQLLRQDLQEVQIILAHEALPLLIGYSLQAKLEEGHLL